MTACQIALYHLHDPPGCAVCQPQLSPPFRDGEIKEDLQLNFPCLLPFSPRGQQPITPKIQVDGARVPVRQYIHRQVRHLEFRHFNVGNRDTRLDTLSRNRGCGSYAKGESPIPFDLAACPLSLVRPLAPRLRLAAGQQTGTLKYTLGDTPVGRSCQQRDAVLALLGGLAVIKYASGL